MYKVITRPYPAKDLIAFKAIARRTYMREKEKVTVAGYIYNYCAMQSGGAIHVYKNESALKHDYDNLNLLKIIKLDNDVALSNDKINRIALTAI